MTHKSPCPACGVTGMAPFHTVDRVPVNSCLLVQERHRALHFPTGNLRLARCPACGFIANLAFDPAASTYSPDYEETQGFSPHFQAYIRDLSHEWVQRYSLQGKHVVEIGCGKGEFLVEMLRAGVGTGLGVDPGVHPDRIPDDVGERAQWVRGFFPAELPELVADAVVCRHTLEHVAPVADFMRDLRRAIGDRHETTVLFELPGTQHVLDHVWFWDIYYEHCSYFTAGSLARLMRRSGFQVLDVRPAYDGQYLLIEACPSTVPAAGEPFAIEDDLTAITHGTEHFANHYGALVQSWRTRVSSVTATGGRTVIWGSGSKGVAFLAALGEVADDVSAAVDINPYKRGRFMAGTGHEIVAPKQLLDLAPSLVIAMNSTYLSEIRADLDALGISCDLEGL